jgi:hypothetical protein
MKPILSHDLADAAVMLEAYADRVASELLAKCGNRPDVRVCWSDVHDGYIVVVDTARWSSSRFVQVTDWMAAR